MAFPDDLGGTEAGPSGGEDDDLDSADTGGGGSGAGAGDDSGGGAPDDDDDRRRGSGVERGGGADEIPDDPSDIPGLGPGGAPEDTGGPPSLGDPIQGGSTDSGPPAPDTLPDPAAESSPGGENVTAGEASRLLDQAEEKGVAIENLEERDALADQIENVTGFGAREAAARTGLSDESVSIGLDAEGGVTAGLESPPQGLRPERARRAVRERLTGDIEAGTRPSVRPGGPGGLSPVGFESQEEIPEDAAAIEGLGEGGVPEGVPEVAGRKTLMLGPTAAGNPTGAPLTIVQRRAGAGGRRVFSRGDDPFIADEIEGRRERQPATEVAQLSEPGLAGLPTVRVTEGPVTDLSIAQTIAQEGFVEGPPENARVGIEADDEIPASPDDIPGLGPDGVPEDVPDIDGQESVIFGPQNFANPTDSPLAVITSRAGVGGVPAFPRGDDPFVPDAEEGRQRVTPGEREAFDVEPPAAEAAADRFGGAFVGTGVAGQPTIAPEVRTGEPVVSEAGVRDLVIDTEAGDLRDTEARLAGAGLVGDLEAEPGTVRPGRGATDQSAADRPEQFGDIDFSAGLGDPKADEVERFTDETLPEVGRGVVGFFGLDEEAPPTASRPVQAGPFVSPTVGLGGRLTPGRAAGEAAREGIIDFSRTPATGLEAFEAAEYLGGPLLVDPTLAASGAQTFSGEEAVERSGQAERAGVAAGAATVEEARENPRKTIFAAGFGAATSAGTGLVAGRVARALRYRTRTAGAADVDAADLTGEDVLKATDPDADADAPFPPVRGSTDPADQADVLERQAGDFTPEEVLNELGGEAPEGTADLKKALPNEPEGPDGGRGFQAPPSDTAEAAAYETPGTSVGPELSPYFFGEAPSPRFSPVPGFPDLGGKPTAAIIRTDIEATDAADVGEFSDELLAAERAGDRSAYTLPADEFAPGEAELVIPPSATFRQVTDTGGLRRFGVGSDLAVETPGGQRVPVRIYENPDLDAPAAGGARTFDPDAGLLGDADAGAGIQRSIAEIERMSRGAATPPTDRPLPILPGYSPSGNVSDVPAAESRADLVRRETAPPDEDEEPETLEEFFDDRRRRDGEDGARSVTPDDLLAGGGATSSAAGDTTRADQPSAVSDFLASDPTSPGGPSSGGGPTSGGGSSALPSTPPSTPSSVPPSTPPPSGGSGGPPSTVPPSIPPTSPPVGGPPTAPPSLREGDDGDSRREREREPLIPLEFQFQRAVGEVDQLVAGGDVAGGGEAVPGEAVPIFEASEQPTAADFEAAGREAAGAMFGGGGRGGEGFGVDFGAELEGTDDAAPRVDDPLVDFEAGMERTARVREAERRAAPSADPERRPPRRDIYGMIPLDGHIV